MTEIITGNFVMRGEEKYLRNTTLDERLAALKTMRKQQNVYCNMLEQDYIKPVAAAGNTIRPLTVLALMYFERAPREGYWKFAEYYGVTFILNDKADREQRA